MQVLGIDVTREQVHAWRQWLAPKSQPFVVSDPASTDLSTDNARQVSPELRDTLKLWRVKGDASRVWLSETKFNALPRPTRARLVREQVRQRRGAVPSVKAWSDLLDGSTLRAQADGHRFVWWPSLLSDDVVAPVLKRVVEDGRPQSRHRDVPNDTWRRCATVVPAARRLAGTFPPGSGPNCFGSVVGACGVDGVEFAWLQPPEFEEWLARDTKRGGDDNVPGTVLVWRDRDGVAQHAAVTIGDGWAFEKPSQEWSSPRWVLTVRDVVRSTRQTGLHLSRYSLLRT